MRCTIHYWFRLKLCLVRPTTVWSLLLSMGLIDFWCREGRGLQPNIAQPVRARGIAWLLHSFIHRRTRPKVRQTPAERHDRIYDGGTGRASPFVNLPDVLIFKTKRPTDLSISEVKVCKKWQASYRFPLDDRLKRSARRVPVAFSPCSWMVDWTTESRSEKFGCVLKKAWSSPLIVRRRSRKVT